MAEITLTQIGAVVGSAALPGGAGIGGLQVSGAAIGAAIGGYTGRAIDSALAPAIEGPRIDTLHGMGSREGAGMAHVFGRMRVGGQLIWASRFKEKRREQSTSKTGPKVASYQYSVSIAVAIAQGPVTRLDRVWANGEVLALADYTLRFYEGSEDQLPDPLIEAIEGEGNTPAFRGTAYIVFEDLPLDAFGNRLPQLSFEVVCANADDSGLRHLARGVNIIPASGEFVYGSQIVRERFFPGIERALNMNNPAGETDFLRSVGQLQADLPNTDAATLTVAWFGDDLRARHCRVRPGVETRERSTVPYQWRVGSDTRDSAYLVSQSGGSANYGGTPADTAVLEGIAALKADSVAVTLSPFLLMDVPAGNGLPDPNGTAEQPPFPWRGRMSVDADGTPQARTDIDAFLGTDEDFGYRHFILHHARLAAEAGGVDSILIGSEMRGLTRIRDEAGAFPFIEGMVQLAADVKAIVGPDVKVSYAADWTEYGAFVPDDGSGDVLFPMDTLWGCDDIDYVGVDWYPPAGDWRDGHDHLDRQAGYMAADDPAYLQAQMAGGETFDWYYASEADRDAQIRTPIVDTAHGEHWVFRQKDLAGWWDAAHHERPGGVRSASPTGWTPGIKPVRLVEIGFPAVDKGGNAPNLFYDPKSSESALPPYSSGERDDVFQRRALEAALDYWQSRPFIDRAFIWAWDARPWPDFPVREEVWSDGPNWSYGHWLNGRTSLLTLAETIDRLAGSAGISVDTSSIDGLVEGYAIQAPMPLRRALEPLRAAYGLGLRERSNGLVATTPSFGEAEPIATDRLVDPGLALTHQLLDKRPGRLALSYISADGSYAPAITDAYAQAGDPRYSVDASVALVLSDAVASDLASSLLAAALEPDVVQLTLPPDYVALEPGDRIALPDGPGDWIVTETSASGVEILIEAARPVGAVMSGMSSLPSATDTPAVRAEPELVLIDAPAPDRERTPGPLAAVAADPWLAPVSLVAGPAGASPTKRLAIVEPSGIGTLSASFAAGPVGRWDDANALQIELRGESLTSVTEAETLAGANRILVGAEGVWELIGFAEADLVSASTWRLRHLLRGLSGTPVIEAAAGDVCVLSDERLMRARLDRDEIGLDLVWRAGEGEQLVYRHTDRAGLAWTVAHLRAEEHASGWQLSWLPRGADIPDNWDLPDPVRPRQYSVEGLVAGEIVHTEFVDEETALIPAACDVARIAEIGTDGRVGHWVSIQTGAS